MRGHDVFMLSCQLQRLRMRVLVFLILVTSLFASFSMLNHSAVYAVQHDTGTDGMSWPSGQVLPHFCCITTALDEIDSSSLNTEQNIEFATLEGLINRTKPRIYVQSSSVREGPTLWPTEMNLTLNPISDPYSLITKYSSEISGMVIYNSNMPDTINLATTIAGIKGGIVVSPTEAVKLSVAPYNLSTLVDLRTNKFASADAVYQYAYTNYWSQSEHRLIMGLGPGSASSRDYAIATKAMVVWLDAGSSDTTQKSLLDSFYQSMGAGTSYVGWYPNEISGVKETSSYGLATFAADLSNNLTVLGAGTHTINVPTRTPTTPSLQNKIYVSMFMSDGDNVQIDQHLLAQKWADEKRGSVPIGWTIDPALVDMAPAILNYYWRTATSNDELVAGPSGLGYAYPDQMPASALNIYTQQSSNYLYSAGLDIATIWNDTNIMPDRVGNAYVQNATHPLLGVTTQNVTLGDQTGPHIYENSLAAVPIASGAGYAMSESDLETAITNAASSFNGNEGARFVPVMADLNSSNISPTALFNVVQYFSSNPNIVFVGPEEFFHLFNESRSKSFQTSFEPTDIQPDWTDTVDGSAVNIGGACCGLTGPQWGIRSEQAHTGVRALMYSGKDLSSTRSYAYGKIFDLADRDYTVTANTVLDYWIYPQSNKTTTIPGGNNSTCVAVDLEFANGWALRDSNAVDQNGNRMHPASQCNHLKLDQWNHVISNIGQSCAGQTIVRIDVGYDQDPNIGGYRGYIDDISLKN